MNLAPAHSTGDKAGTGFCFGVILLAAGGSRRMGRPKLLLPWGGVTVLGHLLRQWQKLNARQICVVCAAGAQEILDELNHSHFAAENRIFNPAPERGMFSSIQCAAAWPGWDPALSHWIITLGDQPHLRETTLQSLLQFGATNPGKICHPLRNGRGRHPVLLPRQAFAALRDSTAPDLKQFLGSRMEELAGFGTDDPGLDLDMDTPADYERALQLYFGNA
jgi:molybdenum cofactor cytidylyltransferase